MNDGLKSARMSGSLTSRPRIARPMRCCLLRKSAQQVRMIEVEVQYGSWQYEVATKIGFSWLF